MKNCLQKFSGGGERLHPEKRRSHLSQKVFRRYR